MKSVNPYPVVMSVRTVADETCAGAIQARLCDWIYERIQAGEWRLDQAVHDAAYRSDAPQWVVISISDGEDLMLFGYFWAGDPDGISVITGGFLDPDVTLPMPCRTDGAGSVMAMRVGVIHAHATLRDMFERVYKLARRQGFAPTPEGWEVDSEMIHEQAIASGSPLEVERFWGAQGSEGN